MDATHARSPWRSPPATAGIFLFLLASCGSHGPLYYLVRDAIDGTPEGPAAWIIEYVETGDVTGDGGLDVIGVAVPSSAERGFPGFWTARLLIWSGPAASSEPTAILPVPGGMSGYAPVMLNLVDVTGDGCLDVLGFSYRNDVGSDGFLCIWRGGPDLSGSPPPDAELAAGRWPQFGDVTGDGLVDILAIASDSPEIAVWAGGPALRGLPAPDAVLPAAGPFIFDASVEDVTGDGIRDVIGVSPYASGTVTGEGAIFVWAGGSLSGVVPPTAILTVPGAAPDDHLGFDVRATDLTRDGVPDILASAPEADVAGRDDGAMYLWEGGAGLATSPPPRATLYVPGASDYDALASPWNNERPMLVDVTGSPALDLVAVVSTADEGGARDSGAIYVWADVATLSGSVAPTATLRRPVASADSRLGRTTRLADVTGDGRPDVLATVRGGAYVWSGGASLTGQPPPWTDLGAAGEYFFDPVDVTGDGTEDVLVGNSIEDPGTKPYAGVVRVFSGGPGLAGSPAPAATLWGEANDQLSFEQVADVTGDGVRDVLTSTTRWYRTAVNVRVWEGGAALAGTPAPWATLTAGDVQDVSPYENTDFALQVAEVTGAGPVDIVVSSRFADFDRVPDAGVSLVWAGGPTLVGTPLPTATLVSGQRMAEEHLGWVEVGAVFADLTGDGTDDLLIGSRPGPLLAPRPGCVYVWPGGPSLRNLPAPATALSP